LSTLTILEMVQALPEVNWVARVVGTRLKVLKVVSELPGELEEHIQQLGREKNHQCEDNTMHIQQNKEDLKKRKREENEAYYDSKGQ
jgi:hypothetical protein